MDPMLLRIFQEQVRLQCRYVLHAYKELQGRLERDPPEGIFFSLQNLVNAAANVSKSLWGANGRLNELRTPLRESIGVGADSPLREVTMRNNFEHLDERIDRWWKESPDHNHIDLCVMPTNAIQMEPDHPFNWFRNFDPETEILRFWGDEFNVREIAREAQRILRRVETVLAVNQNL